MTGTTDEQIDLLERTNAWVQGQARRARSERRWNQDVWRDVEENPDTHRCATSFCFAGKASELAGSEWKWTARQVADCRAGRVEFDPDDPNGMPDGEEDLLKADDARDWPEESASRRAQRVLGLGSEALFGLFSGSNSARDIDVIVRHTIARKRG